MILKVKDKEYVFNATMKSIVAINKKSNVKNLRDTFFKALNDVDFEFLANILLSFADDPTKKMLGGDINKVYDLMENWVNESTEEDKRDYSTIYTMVADEINDKSFFGKKMSKKEMESLVDNPLAGFDINQIISNTAEKVIGETVKEEFQGYKG